ncbi:MAG: DUF4012 domain-containing protein [Patescibacteria group bacterium]
MEGFEKIDLSSSKAAKNTKINDRVSDTKSPNPAYSRKSKNKFGFLRGRNALIVFGVILVLIVLSAFAVVLPAQKVIKSAKATQTQAKLMADALKTQNIELASSEIVKTKQSLAVTQEDLSSMGYLKFVPLANFYYGDAEHLVKAGAAGLDAAEVFINSVKPYADVLGLKGQGSFVGGTAEQRIETAVKTMDKVTPYIDNIAEHLKVVEEELDGVNPNRYPRIFGLTKVHDQLISIKTAVDEGVTFIDEAKPLIKVLPKLLGQPEEKKYLVLFQNDKELRPTGGFITAYAIFRIDKGIIHVDKSENIYNLDNTIPNKPKAPEPIRKYFPKVPLYNLRDSNLSPDFIESMKEFNSLYDKARGKVEVDGIIALDTHVLVSTIKILDDSVSAAGKTFNTKIDPRCDCPQVIYELEQSISTPLSLDLRVTDLAAVQAGRKAIIGDLLYAIMEKAMKSSPKVYWGPLFQDLAKEIEEKHVMFNIYDEGAQQGIHAINADGMILPFEGDYLHINEANFSGSKANLYVSKQVTQDYKKQGDNIVKTVTINFKNSHRASDCNLERGGLCLNSVYKSWFRIYTPKGSKMISSRGSEVKMTSYNELGKTVFDGFLSVRPLGQTTFTITYSIPANLAQKEILPLLIQKQPGLSTEEYDIKVNGKTTQKINLNSDKETKVSL